MRRADAHVHLFQRPLPGRYGAAFAWRDEMALYTSLCAAHDIERALVVGFEGAAAQRGNSTHILGLAATRPWLRCLAHLGCDTPPSARRVAQLAARGFAGVALMPSGPSEARALAAWPTATTDAIAANGFVVSLTVAAADVAALDELVSRLAGARVLLSHLGLPGRLADHGAPASPIDHVCRLAHHPHLGVKVSGLYAASDPPFDYPHRGVWPALERLRDAFGASRLYWGSDFPPALQHVSFAQTIHFLDHLSWSEHEVRAVMGENLLAIT